ncbi:MAG: HisA/HisF-related TIM barrel protein [Candidatus Carbobacillus sp.]|nr:HisA/HisF-related TIM barrel protein [Candidatus Carbobacillus sp.]
MLGIVPCLDIQEGKVVKGVQFADLAVMGDPLERAQRYAEQGADMLAMLDITATVEGRETFYDLVSAVRERISMPLLVGGGLKDIEGMRRVRTSGADLFSVGSRAVEDPELIAEAARIFGSEHVVVAVDATWDEEVGTWVVVIRGGRQKTPHRALDFAKLMEEKGAGMILLTSMDQDGRRDGYDLPLTQAVAQAVDIPVIASGGAGRIEHFIELERHTKARYALAASVFHRGELTVDAIKQALRTAS